MRESQKTLRYVDGEPGQMNFRFTRSQDDNVGVLGSVSALHTVLMTRSDVDALVDMLKEVLDDWA